MPTQVEPIASPKSNPRNPAAFIALIPHGKEFVLSYEDQEYHRRRSEIELDQAVSAEDHNSAIAHLELARMHRARRTLLAQDSLERMRASRPAAIIRADKEA